MKYIVHQRALSWNGMSPYSIAHRITDRLPLPQLLLRYLSYLECILSAFHTSILTDLCLAVMFNTCL